MTSSVSAMSTCASASSCTAGPGYGTLADAIDAFQAGLPGPDTLTVSFLGAVNLSKPHERLDVVPRPSWKTPQPTSC